MKTQRTNQSNSSHIYRQFSTSIEISTKNEFNDLGSLFLAELKTHGVEIKRTRSNDLLSTVLGFKSSNGLIHSLSKEPPVKIVFPNQYAQRMNEILKNKHQISNVNSNAVLLNALQEYSSAKKSRYDQELNNKNNPYPEEKWILTKEGWLSSNEFKNSGLQLNKHAYDIWETTGTGAMRQFWSVYDAEYRSASGGRATVQNSIELEHQLDFLHQKFGDRPSTGFSEWGKKHIEPFSVDPQILEKL
ncbi:MAG: hypothetical protein JXR47_01135, partial [Thiotrichales bacterium]|nr:hypothetical protein [Thiotrichales bacterium]